MSIIDTSTGLKGSTINKLASIYMFIDDLHTIILIGPKKETGATLKLLEEYKLQDVPLVTKIQRGGLHLFNDTLIEIPV